MVDAYLTEESRQSARSEEKAVAAQVRSGQRPIAGASDARPRGDDGRKTRVIAACVVALALLASIAGLAWYHRAAVVSFFKSFRSAAAATESNP